MLSMARSPFRGGVTEVHRHTTAPIHASTNLVSVFAVKVFMPAGGKHTQVLMVLMSTAM